MGGIPSNPYCSICEFVLTSPPKGTLKNLSEATSAWCALHQRRLLLHPYAFPDPNPEPTISHTVRSKFSSDYVFENLERRWPSDSVQKRWPLAPTADSEHLWESRPSNESPYWIHRPYVRIDALTKVDPETGEIDDPLSTDKGVPPS